MSDVGGFDLFEDAIVAHRQMFNAANERLRTQLLTALGLSDDGKTSLTEYVAQLIAERDAMRAVVEAAIALTGSVDRQSRDFAEDVLIAAVDDFEGNYP